MTVSVLDGGGISRDLGSLLVNGEHAILRTLVASDDGGTTGRIVLCDASGRIVAVGAGVAGTPAGGVMSVQGVAGGAAVPVSAAALPLPSGASTEAKQDSILSALASLASESTLGTIDAKLASLGQKAMSGSVPVAIASDQSPVQVAQSVTALVGATITPGDTSEHTFSSQVVRGPVTVRLAKDFTGTLTLRRGTAGPVIAVLEWDDVGGHHNPVEVLHVANLNELTYQASASGQSFRWHAAS